MAIHPSSNPFLFPDFHAGALSLARGRESAGKPVPGSAPTAAPRTPDFFVSLSPEALRMQGMEEASGAESEGAEAKGRTEESEAKPLQGPNSLSREEQARVTQLKRRDTEVRNHERAHQAAGGRYVGAARFTFTNGPDNRRYATGGEVSIDVSPVANNPEATIRKMGVVRRAAQAPARPSGADRAVAAQATRTEQKAKGEQRAEKTEEVREALENRKARRKEAMRLYGQKEDSGAALQTETIGGETGFQGIVA